MVAEFETVVVNEAVPEIGIVPGDIGVVVHIYRDIKAVEVEFVLGDDSTAGVATLAMEDIRPLKSREILHARELNSA